MLYSPRKKLYDNVSFIKLAFPKHDNVHLKFNKTHERTLVIFVIIIMYEYHMQRKAWDIFNNCSTFWD